MTGTADFKVAEVLSVVDTRQLVEDGDRWVRVPGTGDSRECDRCQRMHEIHVTVRTVAGDTLVVGQGCVRAEGDVAAQYKSLASASRSVEKLRVQVAAAERYVAARRAARLAAEALPFPEVVKSEGWVESTSGRPSERWTTADGLAWVMVASWADLKERTECLRSSWVGCKMAEQGFGYTSGLDLDGLRRRLVKAEKKLAALRGA